MGNKVAESYDDNFLDHFVQSDSYKQWSKNPKNKKLATTNAFDQEKHRVNFDSSNQDEVREGTNPFLNQFVDLNSSDPYNELRADNQTGLEQVAKLIPRAATKALAEIAKLPGVIGGLIAAPFAKENEGFDTVFNNPWIKTIDEINDKINTDLLPVYTKKAVETGNLWDNISSTSFWATDGADGLGFILGMMAPGAAFESLGLGSKMIEAASNSSRLARFTSMAGKAEEGVNALKLMGMTGKNIDSILAVTSNTIFEAGAEAKGVGDDLDRKKPDFIKSYIGSKEHQTNVIKKLQELDQQRKAGLIDIDTYNKLSSTAAQDVAEEKFKEQRALAMRDTFVSNVGILIGPNALMHKAIWGKAAEKFEKTAEQGFKGLLNRAGKSAGRIGKAFASEGFWEEGSQTTVENMYVNKAMQNKLGKDLTDDFSIGDFTKEYVNTVSSTNGQKAIFLGGALGGPMMSYQGRKEDVKNRKHTNEVLDNINKSLTKFNTVFENDIYQKNEDGSFKYKTDDEGNPTTERLIDKKAVLKVAKDLNYTEFQSMLLDHAIETGNKEVVEKIKQEAIFDMIMPAIHNGELGIKALEQKLNEDSKFQELIAEDQKSNNKNKTKDFVKETLETAKYLQEQNDKFKDFSKDVIELKNDKATPEQKQTFLNKLNASYLFTKHNLRQNEKSLKELEDRKIKLLDELNINPELNSTDILDNGRLLQDYKTKSPLLTKTLEEINSKKEAISKAKKDIADIWQGKLINDSFDSFIEEDNKESETVSDENVANADELIDGVKNAQTSEELQQHLESLNKDTNLVDKNLEFKKIKNLVSSINDDSSLENINSVLDELKKSEFNNYNVQKLIKTLENRSNILLNQQEEFKKLIEKLIDEYGEHAQKIVNELRKVEDNIEDLVKSKQTLINDLLSQPEKIRGRNARKTKELIKSIQKQIKELDETIKSLEERKENIKNVLEKVDKNLNYLFGAIEQTPKSGFRSVSDVLNYLYENRDDFKEHRFEISRLTLHKYYTEENIKGLEDSINTLENYKDVLTKTIRTLLDSQENHSEDLYYLQEQLNDTNEQLESSKKEIVKERQKLERLNNAILDTNISKLLKDEIEFWENLKTVKKLKPSSYFNNLYIEKLIEDKENELREKEDFEDKNNEIINEEESLSDQFKVDYIENNYKVGDTFVITKGIAQFLKIKGIKTGVEATITKIDKNKSISLKVDNKNFKLDLNTFYNNVFNPEYNYGTEGGINESKEETKQFDNAEPVFSTNGTKVLSTDDKGEPLHFMNEDSFRGFVEFERNPNIVKVGQTVSFEINNEATQKEEWRLALLRFHRGDYSDLEFLINHLPINVVFESGQKAPINTYYESKEGSTNFDKTSKILRTTILKELQKGTLISDLKTTVEGQYNGELQVENEVVENKVQDLYQFGGDISNIKTDDIYIVDDKGVLRNTKNKIFPTNRNLSPGEIYIQIKTAAGNKFPLKLNVRKIQKDQAEVLYELYKYRFDDIQNKTKAITLGEIEKTNSELVKLVKDKLSKEIAVIDKNYKDISIKDLIDILIWDGTDSIKSRVKFKNTREQVTKLAVFNKEYTKEEFNNSKEDFINSLTGNNEDGKYKRQHIKFKSKKDSGIKSINLNNKKYLNYLLENGILNTNVKVGLNEQSFKGNTSIYLDSKGITVNNELSVFNPEKTIIIKNEDLIMKEEAVKNNLPALFLLDLKLNDDGSKYIDKNGNLYNRVSELKSDSNDINVDSTVRGDVIDELLRVHFSRLVSMDSVQFIEFGKNVLKNINDKKNTSVQFSDKAFEDLHSILEDYKKLFIKNNWKIYTSLPTLAGNIGKKNYAGTIDMLAYDQNTKEFIIIDLKTSSVSRKDSYEKNIEDKFDYIGKDQIQQNAYAELFEQMTGRKISKLFILPLIVPKQSKTSFNVDEVLMDGGDLLNVSMDKNIYQLKNIQKQITKVQNEMEGTESEKNPSLLKAFGIKPPTVKVEKTKITSNEESIKDRFRKDIMDDVENNTFVITADGNAYRFGINSGVLANENTGEIITDYNKTIQIIESYNKKVASSPMVKLLKKIDVNNVKKVWNSQNNSVSLQENKTSSLKEDNFEPYNPFESVDMGGSQTVNLGAFGITSNKSTAISTNKEEVKKVEKMIEQKETIDFNKLTEQQIENAFEILSDFIKEDDFRNITNIQENSKSEIDSLQKTYNYLVDKYNAEVITNELKKC